MKVSSAISPLLLLAAFASANPVLQFRGNTPSGDCSRQGCLSDSDAEFLVNIMVSFSVSFDPTYAGQFLVDDFTVQSDSINILTGGLLLVRNSACPSCAPSHLRPS